MFGHTVGREPIRRLEPFFLYPERLATVVGPERHSPLLKPLLKSHYRQHNDRIRYVDLSRGVLQSAHSLAPTTELYFARTLRYVSAWQVFRIRWRSLACGVAHLSTTPILWQGSVMRTPPRSLIGRHRPEVALTHLVPHSHRECTRATRALRLAFGLASG